MRALAFCEERLTSGISAAALRSLQELDAIKAGALNKVTITDAFKSSAPKGPKAAVRPCTWLGHVNTEAFPPAYVAARHVLSKAAYDGNWDQVFQMLEHGHQQYQENWVNACRLSEKDRMHLPAQVADPSQSPLLNTKD